MSLRQQLAFAGIGWLSGILGVAIVGFVIMPAVLGTAASLAAPESPILLALVVMLCTPAALAGGFVGGRLTQEGGLGGQLIMAALIGLFLTIPVSCISFWYLGW